MSATLAPLRAAGRLRAFADAGLLAPADVHVAARLGVLGGEDDGEVLLAAALAVRGPRLGHVCVDLRTVRATARVDAEEPVDLSGLPWPDPEPWLERLAASPLVTDAAAPLRVEAGAVYLDRFWREERAVAAALTALAATAAPGVDHGVLAAGIARLFPSDGGRQPLAAATAVLRRLAIVGGGPGTGKTTTVARILALLDDQAAAAGRPAPHVALAAPTGKAAARLQEAVREEAQALGASALLGLRASTLHRLLGRRPGTRSRFRHDAANRLPHDVVVVDETSMVSLSLMARLLEAVRPDARLVLVGDPGQLTSIEAGAVLGDVVGPAADGPVLRPAARAALEAVTGQLVPAAAPPGGAGLGDGIVVLDRVFRHGRHIAGVAQAVRRGDGDAVVAALRAGPPERVTWVEADAAAGEPAGLRALATGAAQAVAAAAHAGDARTALRRLDAFRLLCAHRRGPYGTATWAARVEGWLGDAATGAEWYPGRPVLVTENDEALRLYNGDLGVVVAGADGGVAAVFERGGELLVLRPSRLGAVETVHAMTVHKSQGSQVGTAAVLLPGPDSPLLSRELLYTAVTRARERLVLVGTEEALRAAVARPVARATGLRGRLWGDMGA